MPDRAPLSGSSCVPALLLLVAGCGSRAAKSSSRVTGGSSGGASCSGATSSPDGTMSSDSGCGGGDGGPAGQVTLAVDLGKGPARRFQPPTAPTPVSPSVWGVGRSDLRRRRLVQHDLRGGRQGGVVGGEGLWRDDRSVRAGSPHVLGSELHGLLGVGHRRPSLSARRCAARGIAQTWPNPMSDVDTKLSVASLFATGRDG
jgi:hypothetical protein